MNSWYFKLGLTNKTSNVQKLILKRRFDLNVGKNLLLIWTYEIFAKKCPGKENWEFKITILWEHPELNITMFWKKPNI